MAVESYGGLKMALDARGVNLTSLVIMQFQAHLASPSASSPHLYTDPVPPR